jgi:hypothetical protein
LKNDEGGGQRPLIMRNVGMYAASSSSAGHLLDLTNVLGVIIDNCRFSNSGNHSADCMHFEGVIYFTVRDCRVGRARYGLFIGRDATGGNASSGYMIDHLRHHSETDYLENVIRIEGGEGVIVQPTLELVGGNADSQAVFGIYISKDAAISESGNILILHPDMEATATLAFFPGSRHIYVDDVAGVTIVNPAVNQDTNVAGIQFNDCQACLVMGGWIDNDITLSGTTDDTKIVDIFGDSNYSFSDSSSGNNNRRIRNRLTGGTEISEDRKISAQWAEQDIPGTDAGSLIALLGTSDNQEIVVPFDGFITAMSVASNDARTAGTATFAPTVNGSQVAGISVTLDGTNTQYDDSAVARNANAGLAVSAGDRVGVRMVTSSFTPTTADAVVLLFIEQ